MNQRLLMQDMTRGLTEVFAGYELRNKMGVLQQVQVFSQYLPQPEGITFADKDKSGLKNYTSNDYDTNFPCVIIKLQEQEDNEERSIIRSTVKVSILSAIYDESVECQGYLDVLNMQGKMRAFLLENRVLADRYILNMPVKSRLLEVETWPVYWGEMNLVYTIGRPSMGYGEFERFTPMRPPVIGE